MPGHLSTLSQSAPHLDAATSRAAGAAAKPPQVLEAESFHATFTGMKMRDGPMDAVPDREGRVAPRQQRSLVGVGDRAKDEDASEDVGPFADSGDADPPPTSQPGVTVTASRAEDMPSRDTREADAFGAGPSGGIIPPLGGAASQEDGLPGSPISPDGMSRHSGEAAVFEGRATRDRKNAAAGRAGAMPVTMAANGGEVFRIREWDAAARSDAVAASVHEETSGTVRMTGDRGVISATSNALADARAMSVLKHTDGAGPSVPRPTMRGGAHAGPREPDRGAAPGDTAPRPTRADAAAGVTLMQAPAPADATAPPFGTALPGGTGEAPDRHLLSSDRLTFADPGGAPSASARVAVSADVGPQVARQVAAQISTAAAGGADRSIDVILNPAELGRVRITLGPGDGGLIVNIGAERPETLDMMRRHIDVLGEEFRDLGYGGTDFTFSRERAADQHPDRAERSEREVIGGPLVPAAAPAPGIVTSAAVLDRLDIRL